MTKHYDNSQVEYERNNHNSRFIQHEDVIESNHDIHPRKRRRNFHCHQHHTQSQSKLLLVIRLLIFLVLCLLVYYTFLSFYPKPKQTNWNRIWSSMSSII